MQTVLVCRNPGGNHWGGHHQTPTHPCHVHHTYNQARSSVTAPPPPPLLLKSLYLTSLMGPRESNCVELFPNQLVIYSIANAHLFSNKCKKTCLWPLVPNWGGKQLNPTHDMKKKCLRVLVSHTLSSPKMMSQWVLIPRRKIQKKLLREPSKPWDRPNQQPHTQTSLNFNSDYTQWETPRRISQYIQGSKSNIWLYILISQAGFTNLIAIENCFISMENTINTTGTKLVV